MANFTVTLADLRKAGACLDGYNKLIRHLQGKEYSSKDEGRNSYIKFNHKEQISIVTIAENNGLDDALWSLQCVKNSDRDIRLYAVWCARQVEHLMEDQRSKDALNVSESYANGNATDDELAAALAAARDAARDAAWAAARDAAWAAARAAARDAARDAAWAAQKEMLISMCNGNAPWQK